MKPFLQPLTIEEESRYLTDLCSGDEAKQKKAKEKLMEHNMRLVAHIAKKYVNQNEDCEELLSIGCIGLLKAILSYDGSKGSKLGTYAARCIENEFLMMLRMKKKTSKEISLQESVGVDSDGKELHLMDVLVSEQQDFIEEMEQKENTKRALYFLNTELTERERTILNMRYGLENGKEVSQKELGDLLGISRSYVSRIEKKALYKLRTLMQAKG